jgi:hypothetical protein
MLALILILLAFLCFVLAAFGVGGSRLNLVAAGLGLWLFVDKILHLL